MNSKTITWKELSNTFCSRHKVTEKWLLERLNTQREIYHPKGWMLVECEVLDSSRLGELLIIPYGGNGTAFDEVPDHPFSPRGLASDISVIIGILVEGELPR
jgi:hypothetical protein